VLSTCIESRADQLLEDLPSGTNRIAHAILSDLDLFHRFGPCDLGWIQTKIAEGLAMIEGKPEFPDSPAPPVRLARNARVLIVGDWGTGLPGAVAVAKQMRKWVDEARDREQHVIHLGDVYYSGWREEYQTRFLPYWPVDRGDRDVMSWSLNGNHDMYSGGHGYFGFLLHDPRFRGHWQGDPAKETPSSHFSLENDDWQILGLDSSYADHDLAGSQAQWLADKLRASQRKTMLLSHHQPFSAYDAEVSQAMTEKVQNAVPAGRSIDAWIWGHEHRCTVYGNRPKPWLKFGSCVGNGGVPQLLPDPPLAPLPDDAAHAPLTWAYEGDEPADGNNWLRFGFAVLDFDGANVTIRYVDEHNNEVHKLALDSPVAATPAN
jgi:3',5'-cyclic AMP phosphodiesterase CpdA